MTDEDFNEWCSIIRAIALSSKSLTPWELNRDTKLLEGEDIPFKKFNCRSLEEMLQKVPGLKVFQQQGKTVVQAIPTEETAHISKMVKLQKASKKKPRGLPPLFSRFNDYGKQPYNKNVPLFRFNNYNTSKSTVPNYRPNSAEPQKRPSPTQQYDFNASKRTPSQNPITPIQVRVQNFNAMPEKKPSPIPTSTPKHKPGINQRLAGASPASSIQQRLSAPTQPSSIQQRLSAPTQTSSSQQKFSTPAKLQTSSVQSRLTRSVSFNAKQEPSVNNGTSISQRLNADPAPKVEPTSVPIPLDADPRLRLNSYTQARSLPFPIYKDLPAKNQNIYSSVTVNSKKYSSYPREAKTKEEAEKLAAQVALDELIGKDKKPDITTYDKNLVMARVLQIVNDHPNGLFESSLVQSYIARFNESLPVNWLKLVENIIIVDLGANNLVILSPQKEATQRSRPSSPSALLEPDVLQLYDMMEFWLHVYVVYSTTDIWGVIIDENHSDKIDELAKNMKDFYDKNQNTPLSIVPGKYYTVFDSEWWHRVRCIKIDSKTNMATLFFIDRGDEDIFATDKLYPLEPKFCQLPAQSVRVSLAGLEVFENCAQTQTLIENLLVDKDVYVRSMKLVHGYSEERYMATVSGQLYLEQNKEEININESLRKSILKTIVDPSVNLGTDKISQEVHISFVNEKAIYVQLTSKGFNYLQVLMNNIENEYLKNPTVTPSISNFDTSKVYLTHSAMDNTWYRVKILKIENNNQAQVFCVDTGNTLIVTRKDLILLEDLSELLATYPNQALKVRLHKISPIMFDKKMAAHLQELAPKTEVFYMKVVGKLEEVPVVEFYKRTENNFLASLNDTLALEPELNSKDDNNNAKPRIRNDRSSVGSHSDFPLKAPYIPPVGSFFDVHITMAAHPGNFTVQSLKTTHQLEKLMMELSQVCDNYNGPALTPGSVKVGNMYAAKYDDGRWYRAYASKVISQNFCAVYFCDYGDYRAVSLEHLQPLQTQFHHLPYQAIKAKLFGITPKLKGDWTVKDSLRFNELIVTKNFVSVIKSCNVENTSQGETVLSLELIDTSTTEDIYISNVLVNEKRAEKIEQL